MKKLSVSQLETHTGGSQCGMNIAASIIFGGIVGLGPLGAVAAVLITVAVDPSCHNW